MTVTEALKQAEDILNKASVPVALIQQIGVPMQNAAELIRVSVEALEKSAQEQNQRDQEPAGEE